MIRPRSRNHRLFLLAFLMLCGAVVWFLPSKDAPEESLQSASGKTPRSERGELRGGDRARKVLADGKEADESASRSGGALHTAQAADMTNWVRSSVTPTVLTNTAGGIDAVSVPYPSLSLSKGASKNQPISKLEF